MDSPPRPPLIDLSELDGPQHDRVVEALVKAAQTCGFFQVVNHGLPVEFLQELKDSVHAFHNQSVEKKAFYLNEASPSPLVTFVPKSGTETIQYLELKYTNDQDALKYWPDSCKELALKYLKTSSKLAERVLRVLMSNLGVTLNETMVDAYMGEKFHLMNYYPITPPDRAITIRGSGRHTDPSIITVLLQDHIGGLFGKLKDGDLENNYKEEWVQIKPIPEALIIFVGDCLQVLSNGKYKASEHYVETPDGREARVSFPVFMSPRSAVKIGPLPQVVDKDEGRPRYREFLKSEYTDYVASYLASASLDSPGLKPIECLEILSD